MLITLSNKKKYIDEDFEKRIFEKFKVVPETDEEILQYMNNLVDDSTKWIGRYQGTTQKEYAAEVMSDFMQSVLNELSRKGVK